MLDGCNPDSFFWISFLIHRSLKTKQYNRHKPSLNSIRLLEISGIRCRWEDWYQSSRRVENNQLLRASVLPKLTRFGQSGGTSAMGGCSRVVECLLVLRMAGSTVVGRGVVQVNRDPVAGTLICLPSSYRLLICWRTTRCVPL